VSFVVLFFLIILTVSKSAVYSLAKYSRQFFRSFGSLHIPEVPQISIQYLFIKKNNSVERLILGTCGNISLYCKVWICIAKSLSHILGMFFAIKQYEFPDPVCIRLFCPNRIMLLPYYVTYLIQQLHL